MSSASVLRLGRAACSCMHACPCLQQLASCRSGRHLTTAAATADARDPAQRHELMLTLERSVGSSSAADEQLLSTGVFAAEVFPDLPIATTWAGLYKALLG